MNNMLKNWFPVLLWLPPTYQLALVEYWCKELLELIFISSFVDQKHHGKNTVASYEDISKSKNS